MIDVGTLLQTVYLPSGVCGLPWAPLPMHVWSGSLDTYSALPSSHPCALYSQVQHLLILREFFFQMLKIWHLFFSNCWIKMIRISVVCQFPKADFEFCVSLHQSLQIGEVSAAYWIWSILIITNWTVMKHWIKITLNSVIYLSKFCKIYVLFP